MLGLIGMPVRIAREVGETAVKLGLEVAKAAAGVVLPGRDGDDATVVVVDRGAGPAHADPIYDDSDLDEPPVHVPEPDLGPAQQPAPDPVPVPVHVSEEPVLVEESAEAGAEDGAGAQIEVAEPWEGYDRMRVPDIERELENADSTVAAAVKLYEASGRGRRGVLAAADRHMRG
jgi:hypothetical protein